MEHSLPIPSLHHKHPKHHGITLPNHHRNHVNYSPTSLALHAPANLSPCFALPIWDMNLFWRYCLLWELCSTSVLTAAFENFSFK